MSSWRPWVTIVTPSFNQGQFIEDAIVSVKNQTYPLIEHIIMDGGSTDATLDVISRHEASYRLCWFSAPDRGMYDAINKGFALANGSILAYLNCDDLYLPWTVETAVTHLERWPLVFGDLINLDLRTGRTTLVFKLPFVLDYYQTYGTINQPTVFLRREVYETVGLFDGETFSLIADCDYWLRCAQAGFRPHKIWEFLAIQRDHQEMQREAKALRLAQEFSELRRRFRGSSSALRKAYRLLSRAFVRVALFSYKAELAPLWKKLRDSKLLDISWNDCWYEMMPNKWKRRPSLRLCSSRGVHEPNSRGVG